MSKFIPAMEIAITINGEVHKRNLANDLSVDEEHINDTLIDAPGKTAYWNYLYQCQKSIVSKQKVKVERYAAELGKRLREEARADDHRTTDKSVADEIASDEIYQSLQNELLDMEELENQLKAAVEAIRELRSTLISLSANLRTEGMPTRVNKQTYMQDNGGSRLAAMLKAKSKESA
jgi:hypothetical protein